MKINLHKLELSEKDDNRLTDFLQHSCGVGSVELLSSRVSLHCVWGSVTLVCPFSSSSGLVSMNSKKELQSDLSHLAVPCAWLITSKKPMWAGATSKNFASALMDGWSLPHMATGFACWDLTNSAVSLLTVYPKKPVPYGWSVLCTLITMWSWQQSSLQHTVRLPQGALVDGSLCISQSFRHNLHQIRNSSGVWLMNYFNLGEVFSFLEDLISLGQDLGSYGLVNTHVTWVLGHPASSGHLRFDHAASSVSIPLLLLSVPLSLGFLGHFISHVALVLPTTTSPPLLPASLPLLWFRYEFCKHLTRVMVGLRKNPWH